MLALCLLVGCEQKYTHTPDETIHVMAQRLPLAKRYDFFLEVLQNSTLPPNRAVIDDIVMLGNPAWQYTIRRAIGGGDLELEEALHVIDAFGRYCTKGEYKSLVERARLLHGKTKEAKDITTEISYVCGVTSHRDGPKNQLGEPMLTAQS